MLLPRRVRGTLCPFAVLALLLACQSRREPTADSGAPGARSGGVAADTARAASSRLPESAADSAVAVLRDYYDAINARDYRRAYAAWGDDGPPGRPTPAAFAAGYATTDSVRVLIGTPGRIEGAAGSRYLTVPVTLRAFERAAGETRYAGSYTLRRSVVPGADPASRRWHLYRAALRRGT